MVDLKKYTHIIWDWNGTLLDDAWLCVDVMNGMLAERGLPLKTVEEYRELFDFPVKDYYEKLGYDFDLEPFDKVGLEFIEKYNQRHFEADLHPETTTILELFKNSNYAQSILSAREHNELLAETKKLGVNLYFEKIRGLDDHYAHSKTSLGLQLISGMEVPGTEILFIGDTRHDAEVAAEMGVDCLLVSNGHHSKERLLELGLPVINNLGELVIITATKQV